MTDTLDCVVCGSCVVDIVVRPVPLSSAVGSDRLIEVEPFQVTTGGIVSNSGIAMSRLGLKVAALSYVGDDDFATIVRRTYQDNRIDTSRLLTHSTAPTSSTIVLVDASGSHSFLHSQGAPRKLDRRFVLDNLDLLSHSRMFLIGYYSLMPSLEHDLADVLARIRETGCQTALDAAGGGGELQPLDQILPHLDIYVPSLSEAIAQTGTDEPHAIIDMYRSCGAPGLLGVKLGARGALLSPAAGEYCEVPPITPPGDVVDTTGAGDSFYAGLIAGLLRGLSLPAAGRLAAAAGASCVTALGASQGIRSFQETARLAGID